MADLTITAANSVFMLSVRLLFPAPIKLEGYSADAAFETEAVEPAEIVMGVDGKMSAGFVPFLTAQTIQIMPDSLSDLLFEQWLAAQKAAKTLYYADAVITLPSVGKKYVCTKGVLSSIVQIPPARKVLGARPFRITWEDASPSPLGV